MPIFSFLAVCWKAFLAIFARNNAPDMVANKEARTEAKLEDDNAALESRAFAGDKAALDEIRRKLAE